MPIFLDNKTIFMVKHRNVWILDVDNPTFTWVGLTILEYSHHIDHETDTDTTSYTCYDHTRLLHPTHHHHKNTILFSTTQTASELSMKLTLNNHMAHVLPSLYDSALFKHYGFVSPPFHRRRICFKDYESIQVIIYQNTLNTKEYRIYVNTKTKVDDHNFKLVPDLEILHSSRGHICFVIKKDLHIIYTPETNTFTLDGTYGTDMNMNPELEDELV
jgi:hypothetical protein